MVHHVTAPKLLDGPGNSPDLNPLENLWTVLKDKVSEKQPTNTKELEEAIKTVRVLELLAEYCRSLVESMPKRLEAVIKAKGGNTDFFENSVSNVCDLYVETPCHL